MRATSHLYAPSTLFRTFLLTLSYPVISMSSFLFLFYRPFHLSCCCSQAFLLVLRTRPIIACNQLLSHPFPWICSSHYSRPPFAPTSYSPLQFHQHRSIQIITVFCCTQVDFTFICKVSLPMYSGLHDHRIVFPSIFFLL